VGVAASLLGFAIAAGIAAAAGILAATPVLVAGRIRPASPVLSSAGSRGGPGDG
jgi:hypothetical protein